jgi:hypothetical protein
MWVVPSNTTIEEVIIYLLTTIVSASYTAIIRSYVTIVWRKSLVKTFKICHTGSRFLQTTCYIWPGPHLHKGQRGPGPGRQISRGGILKKIEIQVWYAGKKRLSTREKFKGDLYWKHYALSFVGFLCLHITEYEQIRGGGGIFLGPGA